jgi:dCMP deaminase
VRPDRDTWLLDLVAVVAKRATCLRRQVGCVLVNERGQVLATGYNGVAAGEPHCNEAIEATGAARVHADGSMEMVRGPLPVYPNACPGAREPSGHGLDGCRAVHAEQNALLQCGDVYAIHTAYVSCSPCVTCVKLLMNTGCRRIVFTERYAHDDAARELWLRRTYWVNQEWEERVVWIHIPPTQAGDISDGETRD